jgi:HlyD family secretion protein
MNRKTMFYAGGAAVALVALLGWAFAPRPVEVEVAPVSTGPFETTIDEDARTRLLERYVVSAPLAGRLRRIALREGDRVAEGDALATLMPLLSPMLDERTRVEQGARVGAAEAALQLASSRVGTAQVALEQARNEQRRTEQLAQQGFVSPNKIDADRLAVRAAAQELATATEGVHVAGHDLSQARAALQATRGGSSAGFVLQAPVSARVLKIHQTSEATVALGTPLLELGDTARLEIVAELLSSDALAAQPGSTVRIERWGGPTVLQGVVRRVEPAAFTKVSALGVEEQRVNVLIDITSPAAEWAALGDGYRVGVRIVTRSEASVLRVPVNAVFPLEQPAGAATAAVFVVDGGRAALRPVQVVARNGSMAWLRVGPPAGAQVIVYPPSTVGDGTRVAPRKV